MNYNKLFQTYGLEPTVLKRASALYPRLKELTGPTKGFPVEVIAIAPICALIASEQLDSRDVDERRAQAMSCQSQADFAKSLKTARAALENAETQKATTPRRLVLPGESAKAPSSENLKRTRSSASKPEHTFESLCHRYGYPYKVLQPELEKVYAHLSTQGWNAQKWEEYKSSIRATIFYWVCQEKRMYPSLRTVEITAEELSIELGLMRRILKSMDGIRKHLHTLIKVPKKTGTPATSSMAISSPEISPSKPKVATPSKRKESSSAADDEEEEPSSKRVRRDAGSSPIKRSDGTPLKGILKTPKKPPILAAASDVDHGMSADISAPPSQTHDEAEDDDDEPPESPTKPYGPSSSSRKNTSELRNAAAASSIRDDDDDRMDEDVPDGPPRYRPVFPDREFWTMPEEDNENDDAEFAQLSSWLTQYQETLTAA